MVSPVGLNQYPNADPSGQPLPFSIGDPYGLATIVIGVADSAILILPAAVIGMIGVFFAADARCVIAFNSVSPTLAAATFSADHRIIPKNGSHAMLLADNHVGCISADGSTTGKLYVTIYRPWKQAGIEALKQRM